MTTRTHFPSKAAMEKQRDTRKREARGTPLYTYSLYTYIYAYTCTRIYIYIKYTRYASTTCLSRPTFRSLSLSRSIYLSVFLSRDLWIERERPAPTVQLRYICSAWSFLYLLQRKRRESRGRRREAERKKREKLLSLRASSPLSLSLALLSSFFPGVFLILLPSQRKFFSPNCPASSSSSSKSSPTSRHPTPARKRETETCPLPRGRRTRVRQEERGGGRKKKSEFLGLSLSCRNLFEEERKKESGHASTRTFDPVTLLLPSLFFPSRVSLLCICLSPSIQQSSLVPIFRTPSSSPTKKKKTTAKKREDERETRTPRDRKGERARERQGTKPPRVSPCIHTSTPHIFGTYPIRVSRIPMYVYMSRHSGLEECLYVCLCLCLAT